MIDLSPIAAGVFVGKVEEIKHKEFRNGKWEFGIAPPLETVGLIPIKGRERLLQKEGGQRRPGRA